MRVQKSNSCGNCEVVVAQFIFGPICCNEPTQYVTFVPETLRVAFICLDHIVAQRKYEKKEAERQGG